MTERTQDQAPAMRLDAVPTLETALVEYQETRHKLKNALAVIMALAEMTERNPAYAPRLISCVLEKGPQMVEHLDELTLLLENLHKGEQ